ncbi:MAG TPA: CHASE2 domain-containing protein [Pyrinomonadaceae bacterium]
MGPHDEQRKPVTFFRWVFKRVRQKGAFYWGTVVALIVIGVFVGRWLEKQEFALELRYKLFKMVQSASPNKPFVQGTSVVLIGDEEYWKGDLARRIPIKRDYLAALLRRLDKADPAVIALDFDLRAQTPDGSYVMHPDYQDETKQLLEAVRDVSKNRSVILPKTMTRLKSGGYVTEPDIYDGFDFQGGKVRTGYIALPFDIRKVPLSQKLRDGGRVESFAEAIVRARNERALDRVRDLESLPYGDYLEHGAFDVFSPADVLANKPEVLDKLRHDIVIVGAGWSNRAYGRGGAADSYFTPVGPLQGALIHANFVEALLGNRTSRPFGETALKVIEVIATLLVAVIFALISNPLGKFFSIVLLMAMLVLFSIFSRLNLGLFYDFFIPMLLVVVHAAYEQIREWQTHAHRVP